MNPNRFPILIERYFSDHLHTQRNASIHTISAYRDTFRLLLGFLAVRHRTTIDRLSFREFSADDVLAFLDHLERKRGNTIRSRNARLAAIRGFTRFAIAYSAPDFITAGQRILAIPCKRTAKAVLGFMSRDEVTAVLGATHQVRAKGLRMASIRDFHSFRVTWVTIALTAGVPLEIVQKVTGHRTAGIVMKHYFQPGREEFRRTLAGKLPVLLGGGADAKPLDSIELRAQLTAMKPRTWKRIRDELLARLPSDAIKPAIPAPPVALPVG